MKNTNVKSTHAGNLAILVDAAMATQGDLMKTSATLKAMTATGPMSRFGQAVAQFKLEVTKLFPDENGNPKIFEKINSISKVTAWVDFNKKPEDRAEQFWHRWSVFFANLRQQVNEHSAGAWRAYHELELQEINLLVESAKQKHVISDMLKTTDQRRAAAGMGWFFITAPVENSEKASRYGVYVKDERARKIIKEFVMQPLDGILPVSRKLEEVAPNQYLLCSLGVV